MALEAVLFQQQQLDHFNGKLETSNSNLYPLLLETWAEHAQLPSFENCLLLDNNHDNNNYNDQPDVDLLHNHNHNHNHDHDHYEWSNDFYDYGNVWDYSSTTTTTTTPLSDGFHQWAQNSSSSPEEHQYQYHHQQQQQPLGDENHGIGFPPMEVEVEVEVEVSRTKRRRARAKKNKEDIENQRMTHIAVERNRRKQMNDYLAVLRNLMPNSYVQRGDQASIIGGAINFVKELEQNLQCLSAQKHTTNNDTNNDSTSSLPFDEFFAFPQYSTTAASGSGGGGGSGGGSNSSGDNDEEMVNAVMREHNLGGGGGGGGVRGGSTADVEVTMVESHALVKIRTKQPPKQLSKLVAGLQGLRLTILHLNVTKVEGVGLFSFSVKVDDESKLNSVDEIAGAVYQLLGRIHGETAFNC